MIDYFNSSQSSLLVLCGVMFEQEDDGSQSIIRRIQSSTAKAGSSSVPYHEGHQDGFRKDIFRNASSDGL
jgi:hypothetical protein